MTKRLIKNKNELILLDHKISSNKKKEILKFKKDLPIFDIDLKNKKKLKNFFLSQSKILKGLNTVVNLAANDRKIDKKNILFQKDFHNYEIKLIKDSLDNNLLGTVNICQEVCKFFLKNKVKNANIINIASTYSVVAPNPSLYDNRKNKPVDYILSKGSIPILTKYIAINYSKRNIRCNCLVPHAIINNPSKEFLKKFKKLSPLGRTCSVDEAVEPLLFLISDGSSYMTGSIIIVDGGWTSF